MTHDIDGAIITPDVVEAIKTVQGLDNETPSIIDKQINLLISQRSYIQESNDEIMEYLEDLYLIKSVLINISNVKR